MTRSSERPRAASSVVPAIIALVIAVLAPTVLRAHHGRDFLLVQTAEMPHPGQLFLISRQDRIDAGDEQEIEWEPAILLGVASRFSLEVHGHVAREGGESFAYESTAPALRWRVTPGSSPWGLALAGEYEIAADEKEPDRVEARLALSRPLGGGRIAVNLVAGEEQEAGADVEWLYAAGLRLPAADTLHWGIEAEGTLEGPSSHELLAGLYWEPSPRWTINAGLGGGVDENELDVAVRTAVVWRAR
jgi:hypothetical protein